MDTDLKFSLFTTIVVLALIVAVGLTACTALMSARRRRTFSPLCRYYYHFGKNLLSKCSFSFFCD